jgi:hypothetical protein
VASFLQFLQLLYTLGPYLLPVWQQIVALIQAHRGPQPLGAISTQHLSASEHSHFRDLESLASLHGTVAASSFNIGAVLEVWQYIRQHPEVMQAIQTLIAAFRALQPAQAVKLGKKAARKDERTFRLANYLTPLRLPQIPSHQTWSTAVPRFPMYENDKIGDCAIAGPAHLMQVWTFNDKDAPDFTPTDQQVVAGYEKVGHYNPNDPATDGGCVLLDVMNTWRKEGLCTHKIGGFVSVTPADHEMVCAGIHLFGGLTIGLNLPAAAQSMDVWQAPSRFHRYGPYAPGSWGGHCVIVTDYDEHDLTCVTWGGLKKLSWNFLTAYCDEAYAAVSVDWLGPDGKAPNGFDTRALAADLAGLH